MVATKASYIIVLVHVCRVCVVFVRFASFQTKTNLIEHCFFLGKWPDHGHSWIRGHMQYTKQCSMCEHNNIRNFIVPEIVLYNLLPYKMITYLHWEVRVLLIVLQYISDSLVNHGEERFQSPHACEVHDVLLFECKLKALDDQSIGSEVFLNDIHKVGLNL